MTTFLTLDQVLAIHESVTGDRNARDAGAIQSAIGRPQATAFGKDAYATLWEKGAALLQSLARNHGFTDGNKRTAWVAAVTFLEVNGHPLEKDFDVDGAEALVLAVATGALRDVPAIASDLIKFTG